MAFPENNRFAHVAVVHNRGLKRVSRMSVAIAGGPNAKTAAQLAVNLASAFNAEIHFLNVARPDNPNAKGEGQARIAETLHEVYIPRCNGFATGW